MDAYNIINRPLTQTDSFCNSMLFCRGRKFSALQWIISNSKNAVSLKVLFNTPQLQLGVNIIIQLALAINFQNVSDRINLKNLDEKNNCMLNSVNEMKNGI